MTHGGNDSIDHSAWDSVGDLSNNVTVNSLGDFVWVAAGIGVIAVITAVILVAASSVERYRWVREVLSRIERFLLLALKGAIAAALAAVIFSPFLALARADTSTQAALGRWALITVAVLTLLACIGLVAEWVWDQLQAHRAELSEPMDPAEPEEVGS